jgi:hypothetical protein
MRQLSQQGKVPRDLAPARRAAARGSDPGQKAAQRRSSNSSGVSRQEGCGNAQRQQNPRFFQKDMLKYAT